MDGTIRIDLDKLPVKRLEAIDESGAERFPPEVGLDEKRLDQIRRIDFSWLLEKDAKKAKSSSDKEAAVAAPPWPWQSLVENLQLAQQELSVILDLINTVEANDAVTVAGMTRPKPLPNEVLSDLSVSAATKLKCFRHLGKYFKQSSKALDQQVAREARFYGALIRLQQNWKVKRQRLAATGPGSECFCIDLLDNTLSDPIFSRFSSASTVRVDHDSSGMLTMQLPPKSRRFMKFGYVGGSSICKPMSCPKVKTYNLGEDLSREGKREDFSDEDVNESVKESHSVLREIHQSIFEEQVFDLVNRETFTSSPGVHLISMHQDFLQFGLGEEASVFLSLVSAELGDSQKMTDTEHLSKKDVSDALETNSLQLTTVEDKLNATRKDIMELPDPDCFLIYLQHVLHENLFFRSKEGRLATKSHVSEQSSDGGSGLLAHFCLTIAHRIFSKKVLAVLENLASGVPYLHLLTYPTWHSRTSSWSLSVKFPELIVYAGQRLKSTDTQGGENQIRLQFHTKVAVRDERISVSGQGTPNVINSFSGKSVDIYSLNSYGCDLADLPAILLQQVASQVICWLHEEALVLGVKATRDFLCLYFELEEASKIGLLAHVDHEDVNGCISWWLVIDDGAMEEGPRINPFTSESENRRLLGHLSLEALYATLMDLVSLCTGGNL